MKRYLFWAVTMVLTLTAVSCKDKKDRPTVAPPVKVKVMEVATSDAATSREYSGTVSSSQTTTVSFSVGGTIAELYGREGQKVSKGQLLGKVKNGDYLNAFNIANAQLAEAQDGYNRLKKLHDANALPEVKWVEMEQKLKQAQNAAEMAQRTLNDANLYSPATGTISQKFADVGQTIIPAQPVYEIVSTSELEIDVPVSENEVAGFSIGQKAAVSIDAAGTQPLEGKVTQKTVVADPLTRSFTVKVKIPDARGKILPGMIGNVVFEKTGNSDTKTKEIMLPSGAVLLNDDNRWFVWVVADSVAERRFVNADHLTSDGVLIESGLMPGDKVIVEGVQKVGTGTRVVW